MNHDFWIKTTNFKLFGKYTLLTKEEVCSDMTYEGDIYHVTVTQDYYNQEFKTNEKKKE